MFQEPKNYLEDDHFFFESDEDLEKTCNAPKDKDGVFKVIELRHGRVNLVFIGYSTTGGLFNEIVNGLHFDKNLRKLGWKLQVQKDQTDALDIYWYATRPSDIPKKVCAAMLKDFSDDNGEMPKWNK